MISVTVTRNSLQEIEACHIKGHADYDDHGYDIVCAAISALSCTAILGLQTVAKQQGVYNNRSGHCEISLTGEMTKEGQAILETMVLGIREISRQYADFVSICDQ